MKRFKLFLAAFALTVSTATFANYDSGSGDTRGPMKIQIEKMLSDAKLLVDEEFIVTVIFKVNEESKIEIRKIDSPNEEVNEFLRKRLENRKLFGKSWDVKMIYELPVRVQATR